MANLGILFQINDDYINLFDTNYAINKGFYDDLREKKLSFPILIYL